MNKEEYVKAKQLVLEASRKIKSEAGKKHFSLNKASHSEIRKGEILDGEPIDRIFLVLRGRGCEYALMKPLKLKFHLNYFRNWYLIAIP